MVVRAPFRPQPNERRAGRCGGPRRKNSYSRPKKSRPATALVVDDEWLIRWSIAEKLRDGGFQVVLASDGTEAIQHFRWGGVADVIVVDPVFPNVTELDFHLIARLRALAPSARLVVMTAGVSPELDSAARSEGADCVVDKPFDMNDLLNAIRGTELPVR
mgnify:CR=1 FL=1